MEITLHFDGLKKGQHTWFYNARGAQVRIQPDEYAIIDTTANPFWKQWIDQRVAKVVERIPDGTDFLYERSEPRLPKFKPPWGNEDPPRGAFSLYGQSADPVRIAMSNGRTVSVLDLGTRAIERIRLCYMPRELPGFGYTDARGDKRRGRSVHALPPPFERNFFVLVRLAWLSCRRTVEIQLRAEKADWSAYERKMKGYVPEEPSRSPGRGAIRKQVDLATAKVLRDWGVLRRDGLPDRVTIYRELKAAYLTRDLIDELILSTWKELREASRVTLTKTRISRPRNPNKTR